MSIFEHVGNPDRMLTPDDYNAGGELASTGAELSVVVGSAKRAEQFIADKQYGLLWRDADMLFQSPRPFTTFENSYVLEPNVQRFTVATVCNSVVPQLYKGLFYTDPPMLIRPRPGTKQEVVDAKTALASYLLDECQFKTETKWGLEQMTLLGTGIFKWGVEYKEVQVQKRTASVVSLPAGPTGQSQTIPTDEPPKIETRTKVVPRPFFESRPLSKVLFDPKCEVGDIRQAKYVIDVRYMDYYEFQTIQKALNDLPDGHKDKKGWNLPSGNGLMEWWMPPTMSNEAPTLTSDQATYIRGVVHHAEEQNIVVTPDLLRGKKEVLEYWDADRKIMVIDRLHVFYSGDNPFGRIPFLSANWWNRPKAMYGMGLGLIVGQNQRVDQGTINAILKILAYGVNPIYLRKRDTNSPTQMIRTGLGKILTVDTEVDKSYKLLETPKVPPEVWAALQESEKATQSSSGADQTLVQGSTAGPRTSMGRTAGGAGILANASATRLDGPLDNFIEQVFKPFLYILDYLIFNYFPDAEIQEILGEELGKEFNLDLQNFHDAKIEYEVLAGASLAAKRTMAQSMTLITQIFSNPQIQESLADINEEYIDFKPILRMWMEASEWKNVEDIIKAMTPQMKAKRQAQSQAALQQSKSAVAQQSEQQKFANKQELEDQATDGRIKRDIVREAFRYNGNEEASEGEPSVGGLEGQDPTVE
jgi:hypothetical protein